MQSRDGATAEEQLLDPVCGMTVDPAHAAGTIEHGGRTYGFCCPSCERRFREDPARFVAPPPAVTRPSDAARPAGPGAVYTCPMHPEVVREGPGSCPICGMALEPRTVSLAETENRNGRHTRHA